jgi:hypothetical protein
MSKYDSEKDDIVVGTVDVDVDVETTITEEQEVFQVGADGTDYRDVSW